MLNQTGESLRIEDWYRGSAYRMAEIRFADGTVWTSADVDAMPSMFRGTEKGETIYASAGADIVYGNGGDDSIHAYGGDDTLTGGSGDDALYGGSGDDTYLWNPGDGSDSIANNDGVNVLRIGQGVAPSDVVLKRTGTNETESLPQTLKRGPPHEQHRT